MVPDKDLHCGPDLIYLCKRLVTRNLRQKSDVPMNVERKIRDCNVGINLAGRFLPVTYHAKMTG